MADSNLFTLKIITPDRVFYEGEVSMVEFNTTEGEIGVLKGHNHRGRRNEGSCITCRFCRDSAGSACNYGRDH